MVTAKSSDPAPLQKDSLVDRVVRWESGPDGGWGRILLVYCLLALLAFPMLETAFLGRNAPHYAHDVFDDGGVSRLGALVPDWEEYGFTLWNPRLTAGTPLLSQFAQSPFSLDVWLTFLVDPFVAYMVTYYLLVLLAGVSMHLFLRGSLRLGELSCFAGGILYLFSFWHYIGFAVPLLPMVLWLFDKATAAPSHKARYYAACVGLAALLFYNSHSQLTILVAALHLTYLMIRATSRSQRFQWLGSWTLVWAFALMLYGPVLVTQLTILPLSHRTLFDSNHSTPNVAAAVQNVVNRYSSLLLGARLELPFGDFGLTPGTYGTYYAGPIGLGLILLGALKRNKSRTHLFLIIALLLVPFLDLLALTVGNELQQHLPLLRSFHFYRVAHFVPFLLAANAAIGASSLTSTPWHQLTAGRLPKVLWAVLLAALTGQTLICARNVLYILRTKLGNMTTHRWESLAGWSMCLGYMLLGAALYLWLAYAGKRRSKSSTPRVCIGLRTSTAGVVVVCALLFAVDRLVFSRIERLIDDPKLASYNEVLSLTPALSYLKKQENSQTQRTLTLGNHTNNNRIDHANRMLFHRMYAADGYENIYSLRYHELFGLLTEPHLSKDQRSFEYFQKWGNRAYAFGPEVKMPLASLMGIRWFFARGVEVNTPELKPVFRSGEEQVLENPGVFPRAFVADCVRTFGTRTDLLTALSSASADELRTCAYALQSETPTLGLADIGLHSSQSARIVQYEPDNVTVDVSVDKPSVLVLTDVSLPGWIQTVNGVEATGFPVYNAFRGVLLPVGHSVINYRYDPEYTCKGLWLFVIGLISTFVWVSSITIRERRLSSVA